MESSMIRDITLAEAGHKKIDWVKKYMPVLAKIEKDFEQNKPLDGIKVTMSIHLEAKTAYLAKVIQAGGAEVAITGSNPLSTQDDVAAALVEDGLHVYSWYNCSEQEYHQHLSAALDLKPDIIIDDGGDIIHLLHTERTELLENIIGGSEETTTGVIRLHAREKAGQLKIPMVSANDAYCKYLFDNRYGTGQSVWDGIMRTTNLTVAGKTVVVLGYGWCGKGVAMRAKGLGANVIVSEVDPIKAIEAHMDGFMVMTSMKASSIGDIFITVTGDLKVLTKAHFEQMKSGAILANAGHFDVEIWKPDLIALSKNIKEVKNNITAYELEDGRYLNLLAEGRLVNLAGGDGHPAEIMDMSFAVQVLSVKYLLDHQGTLENKVYNLPFEIDKEIALMKLNAMGISIDSLTQEQSEYLNAYTV